MFRYALLAAIIAIVTTSSFIIFFRQGFVIPIASAVITAIIINFLWWRSRQRPPTSREKTTLILVYWFLKAAFVVVPTTQFQHIPVALAMILLNTIVYPIVMLIFFGISEKLNGQFHRAMIFFMVIGSLIVIAMTFYHGFLKISEILG